MFVKSIACVQGPIFMGPHSLRATVSVATEKNGVIKFPSNHFFQISPNWRVIKSAKFVQILEVPVVPEPVTGQVQLRIVVSKKFTPESIFLEGQDWHRCEGAQEANQKELDRVLSSRMEHGLVRGDFSRFLSMWENWWQFFGVEGPSFRKPERE